MDLLAMLRRVHDSHWYILGQEVRAFGRAFAQYAGVDHCVRTGNGTDALELALRVVVLAAKLPRTFIRRDFPH